MSTNPTRSIEVDIAHDCDHYTFVHQLSLRYGFTFTLVSMFGPAGGNPLYRITGTFSQVIHFLAELVEDDEDTFTAHLDRMK